MKRHTENSKSLTDSVGQNTLSIIAGLFQCAACSGYRCTGTSLDRSILNLETKRSLRLTRSIHEKLPTRPDKSWSGNSCDWFLCRNNHNWTVARLSVNTSALQVKTGLIGHRLSIGKTRTMPCLHAVCVAWLDRTRRPVTPVRPSHCQNKATLV